MYIEAQQLACEGARLLEREGREQCPPPNPPPPNHPPTEVMSCHLELLQSVNCRYTHSAVREEIL